MMVLHTRNWGNESWEGDANENETLFDRSTIITRHVFLSIDHSVPISQRQLFHVKIIAESDFLFGLVPKVTVIKSGPFSDSPTLV
jgi:hypothetical protein